MAKASGVDLSLNFPSVRQGPLNVTFPKGQQAFLSEGEVYFTGATGAVATCLSDYHLGVTMVGTGSYELRFPKVRKVHFHPTVEAPTGAQVFCNINSVNGISGTAKMELFAYGATGGATGPNKIPVRPGSGTTVKLLTFVEPFGKYLY